MMLVLTLWFEFKFVVMASWILFARIVTTVASSTFELGILNPARVMLAGIVISIRASLKGSVVGGSVVLNVGKNDNEGAWESVGLVLGASLETVGLNDVLGDVDGKPLGLADGGSIA